MADVEPAGLAHDADAGVPTCRPRSTPSGLEFHSTWTGASESLAAAPAGSRSARSRGGESRRTPLLHRRARHRFPAARAVGPPSAACAGLSFWRASSAGNQPARSISGNSCVRPERGGHSIVNVLLRTASGRGRPAPPTRDALAALWRTSPSSSSAPAGGAPPVSSSNSRSAHARGSSSPSNSPLGIDHAPASFAPRTVRRDARSAPRAPSPRAGRARMPAAPPHAPESDSAASVASRRGSQVSARAAVAPLVQQVAGWTYARLCHSSRSARENAVNWPPPGRLLGARCPQPKEYQRCRTCPRTAGARIAPEAQDTPDRQRTHWLKAALALCVALAALWPAGALAAPSPTGAPAGGRGGIVDAGGPDAIPGSYIVVLKNSAVKTRSAALITRNLVDKANAKVDIRSTPPRCTASPAG